MRQNAFIAKVSYKVGSLMMIRGKNMQPGTHDAAFYKNLSVLQQNNQLQMIVYLE